MNNKSATNACQGAVFELSKKESELCVVRSRMATLRTQEALLASTVSRLRRQIAPIKRVPQDILAEIFIHCRPTQSTDGRYPLMTFAEAPLLLGRVCKVWGFIANSTPALWDAIEIEVPSRLEDAEHLVARHEKMAKEWLQRAGTRGLSISLMDSAEKPRRGLPRLFPRFCDSTAEIRVYIGRMLSVLLEFQSFWKVFKCNVNWADAVVSSADISPIESPYCNGLSILARQTETPLLEELDLVLSFTDQAAAAEYDIRLNNFPPSLRRVTLEGNITEASTLKLPWGSLARLELLIPLSGAESQPYALQILRHCPNLEECILSMSDNPLSGDVLESLALLEHMTVVFLPFLTMLTITTTYHECADQLLANLQVPLLRDFCYVLLPRKHPMYYLNRDQFPRRGTHIPLSNLCATLDELLLHLDGEWMHLNIALLYLGSGIRVQTLTLKGICLQWLAYFVGPCRNAGVEHLHLDDLRILASPPPPPGVIVSRSDRLSHSELGLLIHFLDVLTYNGGGEERNLGGEGKEKQRASLPQFMLKKVAITMPSSVSPAQKSDLNAYAEQLKTNKGIFCRFDYPPRQSWGGDIYEVSV
jgi:hypothetical protein